jgi:hypothetical protein
MKYLWPLALYLGIIDTHQKYIPFFPTFENQVIFKILWGFDFLAKHQILLH